MRRIVFMHKHAFTLAEVLITLGIIGIVASMTLPAMIRNHRKKEITVKLRYSISILNNAFRLAVADYGDMKTWDYIDELTDDDKRKLFIDKYLIPYIKGSKPSEKAGYDHNGLKYPSNAYPRQPDGTITGLTSPVFYPITLVNGIFFYAGRGNDNSSLPIRVDLNGLSRPNIFGYDIFALEVIPEKNSVYASGWDYQNPMTSCTAGNAWSCAAAIIKNNYEIPDNYPVKF